MADINVGSMGCGQYHHDIREQTEGTEREMGGGREVEGYERERGVGANSVHCGFPVRKISTLVNEVESAHQAVN